MKAKNNINKSLIKINKILNEGSQNLRNFADDLHQISKEKELSFSTVAESAKNFCKKGFNGKKIKKSLKNTL